jgi:hypothetical protein
MKRPKPIAVPPVLTSAQLNALAERCEYEGSKEHKDKRSWLGIPLPRKGNVDDTRQTATICPLVADMERQQATQWVRQAVRTRQFVANKWKGGFPRYIWYQDLQGQYWYGVITNQGAGETARAKYKGWPISEGEWREIFG